MSVPCGAGGRVGVIHDEEGQTKFLGGLGCGKRAPLQPGFHDNHGPGKSADGAVTLHRDAGQPLQLGGKLRQDKVSGAVEQVRKIGFRPEIQYTFGQNESRGTAPTQGGPVRGQVHPIGIAADDVHALLCQLPRRLSGNG